MFKLASAALMTAAAALPIGSASAEPQTFDFGDPKGVNGITFIADSIYEPFVGFAGTVEGTVTFDPENPEDFSGEISVPVSDMSVPNPTMTDHLRGPEWLGVNNSPKVVVKLDSVDTATKDAAGLHLLTVNGSVSLGDMSIDKVFTVRANVLENGAATRGGAESGDLLVLRSEFQVDRSELGVKPEMGGEKVAELVTVIAPIVGYAE